MYDYSEEHEAKCQRCGVSCHFTLRFDEPAQDIVVWNLGCKFLAKEGTQYKCQVYDQRFEKAPWCHPYDVAVPVGMMRTDCPYNDAGKGKTALRGAKYDAIWKMLLPRILVQVFPLHVGRKNFLEELRKREPDTEWECIEKLGGLVFQEKGKPSPYLISPNYLHQQREATDV